MKKKILFVIPEYSHGGTNKSLENLLTFMDKTKYDIHIYCLFEDGGSYYKEVFCPYVLKKSFLYTLMHDHPLTRKVYGLWRKINKKADFDWLYRREINRLQQQYQFDTLIGFQEGAATRFVSYVKDEHVNKIAWYHCPYIRMNEQNTAYYLSQYSQFNSIVCVSKTFVKWFTDALPELAGRVKCVYNTLNDKLIRDMGDEKIDDDRFQTDAFTLVSVGRFARQKQFEKIPAIAHRIQTLTDKPFKWYVIASGDQCKAETENEIRKYGLENTVILLGAKDNPYPYMKAANVVACTSDSESFSYVIAEGKILHTPVLSNNFPVAYEVLPPHCGWVCAMDEMSTLIAELMEDKDGNYSQVMKGVQSYQYENDEIVSDFEELL